MANPTTRLFPGKPGKYRRQFDWRISHGRGDSSRSDFNAMVRLATSDFPDILEDFLSISRKRQHNPTALARLQLHMLEELLIQESAVRHYRQIVKEAELKSGTAGLADTDKGDADVEFSKRELFFYRLYANAVRSMGDGIAWRALSYDRAVARLLGERETKQQIGSQGTIEELREWSYQFDRGKGVAILNALTNCFAIGDVTVIGADGSVEIVEVKSSKTKSSRKVRQKQAMNEVVTLLDSGEGKNEDRDVQIEILAITPETYLNRIEDLLRSAGESGWAARRFSDFLYVEAFDFRKIEKVDDVMELTETVRKNAIGEWEKQKDFVFDLSTLDTITYSPNCAPFSVFPFRARTCVDLLIGAQFYVSFLNLTAIGREFERRGWAVEKDTRALAEEKSTESVLNVRKGPFHVNIPPGDFMRMQIETLRPKTLIDAFEAKLRQGPEGGDGYVLAVYDGEFKIWN